MTALVPDGPWLYRKATQKRFLRLRRCYLRRLRQKGFTAYLLGWLRLIGRVVLLEGRLWLSAPAQGRRR